MLKKFPAKVSIAQNFSLALNFCNKAEDLLPVDAVFNHRLSVTDDIEAAVRIHTANPMHDILPGATAVKYHIAFAQLPIQLFEKDVIPLMNQERNHAVAGNQQTDLFTLFG